MHIQPVILSGGTGTRLWPLSRAEHPKQFLSLTSENSLLQETLLRFRSNSFELPPPLLKLPFLRHPLPETVPKEQQDRD